MVAPPQGAGPDASGTLMAMRMGILMKRNGPSLTCLPLQSCAA